MLHFFTGAHDDYHKPSDDSIHINAAGGAKIAQLVTALAVDLSNIESLTYQEVAAPAPRGDVRGYGASLGTIPDYTGVPEDAPGIRISGIVAGGPAATAGLQGGDRIVELSGREVRDIYDLMYVLQDAKPGEETTLVFVRGEDRFERTVIFGTSSRRR